MIPTQGAAPANGGYFGSMMTGNGGMGGNVGSFTAPPVGNDFLDFLKKIGGMSGMAGGQPQSGNPAGLPPNSFSPFMAGGGAPPQQPPMGAPPMPGAGAPPSAGATPAPGAAPGGAPGAPPFGSLDPSMIKALLARMGMGGGGPTG